MHRGSTATRRQRPLGDVASVEGAMVAHAEIVEVSSTQRLEIVDLTDTLMALVRGAPVAEGLANIFSLHTTCTLFVNEFQAALAADITTFLERLVERDGPWRHNDPACSDCDRMNADAHLRALVLGHSVALQVSGGELVLGQWQRVLLAELDGPRPRRVRVSLLGVGRS
jgi:secondary thiamine-phosphate synthase enzyme